MKISFPLNSTDICFSSYTIILSIKAVSQRDIVDCLLELDEELKHTYFAYQDILSALKQSDPTRLNSLVQQKNNNISGYMKTAIKTTKDNMEYIVNSVK